MPSPPPDRATTLKGAFRVCKVEPLSGDAIKWYYADLSEVRKTEAIQGINTVLDFQEPGEHTNVLFTGHRGCGKSTELKRIQKSWETDYRVIYLEADEETDINDADYTDIYLIVIKQLEFELRRLGYKLDPRLLTNFENWFKEITNEDEHSVESSISVEGEATLIYTVPISVIYSPKSVVKNFENLHIMPMANVYKFAPNQCDLDHDDLALEAMARLIEQRVDSEAVFEKRQHLINLIKASGGHVRQLMQLMRIACQTASTRGHDKIKGEDLDYAIRQEQFNFERFIPDDHYPVLARTCLTKNVPKDPVGQLMMFNLSVLEYNGDHRWNYPNPVVKNSESFQVALQDAQHSQP